MAAQTAQQEGTGFIYGKNAVAELLKSGAGVDTLYVQDTMAPREAAYYTALARQAGAVAKRVRAQKQPALAMPSRRTFLRPQPRPGSRPFWCCATALKTPTTWAPLCARRCCAARTAWLFPSAAAWP